jgi:hypothetical protein
LKQLSQIPPDKAPDFIQGIFSRNAHNYNQDPSVAAKNIEQLKDPAHRNTAIEAVGGSWAWRDPDAAVAWAAKLSSADEKKQVRTILESRIGGRYSEADKEKLFAPLK